MKTAKSAIIISILQFLFCFCALAPASVLRAEEIDCNTRGNSLTGHTGAVLVVTCPPGCSNGPIWGTIIYSDDSAICSAAIHAGHLKSEGGKVGVLIQGSQPRFLSSARNGIKSSSYGAWTRSFSLTAPRSAPSSSSSSSNWLSAAKYWGIILVLGIIFFFWFRNRKKQFEELAKVFADFAKSHGLEHKRPRKKQAGEISGDYLGKNISIRTYTHTDGRNPATTYIEIKILLSKPLPEGLRIFPRTTLSTMGSAADRMGGEKEILTGDAAFDKSVYAGATDETSRQLFTADVQAALADYCTQVTGWDLFVAGDSIKATRTFTIQSRANLESVLKYQGAVAGVLGG